MPQTVKAWLREAELRLRDAGIGSARLDAELILAQCHEKDRTWLIAHDSDAISSSILGRANLHIKERAQRLPLAYIRGWVEFYGRTFIVNRHVLIPRPETETIIDLIRTFIPKSNKESKKPLLIDVGTGCGCIGLTAGLEFPNLQVHLTDIDLQALAVAKDNAVRLLPHHPVITSTGDLLEGYQGPEAAVITANLPYVARHYEISPEAKTEPAVALFAEDDGYALIERLVPQAATVLALGGFLILESDPWQQKRIVSLASTSGFKVCEQRRFHLLLQRH